MANFNDQVNNYIGRYFAHRPLEIRRVDTMKAFERAISGWMNDYFNPASSKYKSKEELASMDSVFQDGQFDEMDECDIHCSLYILYKEEHRVQKLAGRCFSWDNMEEAFIGIKGEELKLEKGRYLGNGKGFCIPRFDAMQAAVLITDYEVVAYGDSYIEADDMDEDLVHCNVYVGYGLVADIHIDTKEFDRFFGLKENFPKQYDEIFGQAKVPYAEPFDAQVEADEQAETEAAQVEADEQADTEAAKIVAETATDKCLEDIKLVKISINSAIGFMKYALQNLDEAKASIERDAGIGDDGWSSLQFAQIAIDESLNSTLVSLNEISGIFRNADKLRLRNDMETPRISIRNK